jgi:dienelactone hydrolase
MPSIRSTLLLVALVAAAACAGQVGDLPPGSAPDTPPGAADAGSPPPPPPPPPSGEVVTTEITELPGSRLMVRPDAIPAPGIVMLHGSEGGSARYIDEDAIPLAEAGFAVLVFCWFDCPGRPPIIHRIPLEDTVAAVQWLRASPAVQGRPVGVYGVSRGAEQAVLLASLLGDTTTIAAVAVHAPSDTIVAAYDPGSGESPMENDPWTGQPIFGAAWTWQGQPLHGERDSFFEPGPRIEVERYPGDLYLSHGTADDLWSVERSQHIEAARDAAGLPTEAHYWQGEGHILMMPANVQEFLATLTAFYRRELGL